MKKELLVLIQQSNLFNSLPDKISERKIEFKLKKFTGRGEKIFIKKINEDMPFLEELIGDYLEAIIEANKTGDSEMKILIISSLIIYKDKPGISVFKLASTVKNNFPEAKLSWAIFDSPAGSVQYPINYCFESKSIPDQNKFLAEKIKMVWKELFS